MSKNLPDVQETKPKIELPIRQVGIENFDVPFMLESKYGGHHETQARTSIRTDLDSSKKGISMSRLPLTLKPYLMKPLKHKLIKDILTDLRKNLETEASFIRFDFKIPITKKSPISDNEFPLYYDCWFECQLIHSVNYENGEDYGDIFTFYQGVKIQYASYCPCSAELSKDLTNKGCSQGYPHAQRSFATVVIDCRKDSYIWLEDIIELVENSIATVPYPIIKRVDEQEIARVASQNPIFVEDAIRQISSNLSEMDGVRDWIVKCSHEESIHTHEAIAINWKGIFGGFDGRYFL